MRKMGIGRGLWIALALVVAAITSILGCGADCSPDDTNCLQEGFNNEPAESESTKKDIPIWDDPEVEFYDETSVDNGTISSASLTIPTGFTSLKSGVGVEFYKRSSNGTASDYVMVIDLRKSKLYNMIGSVKDSGIRAGAYGGPSPTVRKDSLSTHWSNAQNLYPRTFAVFNGQFFDTYKDPTPLAFPIKKDSTIFTEGYGTKNEYVNQQSAFTWNNDTGKASITDYTWTGFQSGNQNGVVGLIPTANKNPSSWTGRTFVGVGDRDNNGTNETVFVYSSTKATQAVANSTLTSFGATGVTQLDGGGSTQINVRDYNYVNTGRKLPHVIVVEEGVAIDDHGNNTSNASTITPNGPDVNGNIEKGGDIDMFRFVTNSTGTITIETLGSMDSYCDLYGANGSVISSDDDSGVGTNCLISRPSMPASTYFVKIRNYYQGGTGLYQVRVKFVSAPTVPPPSTSYFTPITVGASVFGSLAQNQEIRYSFQMVAGRQYTVLLTPSSGDPDLYTSNRSTISTTDWQCRPYLGSMKIERCVFVAPLTGTNYAMIKGYSASAYVLTVMTP